VREQFNMLLIDKESSAGSHTIAASRGSGDPAEGLRPDRRGHERSR
jgi:hypothetical protein